MLVTLPLALFGMSLGGLNDHDDEEDEGEEDRHAALMEDEAPPEMGDLTAPDPAVDGEMPEAAEDTAVAEEAAAPAPEGPAPEDAAAPAETAPEADLFPETAETEEAAEPAPTTDPMTNSMADPVALTDFRPGEDVLEVSLVEGESPEDLMLTATEDGSGTLVQIGADTVALLQGIQPDQIGPDDISLLA
ncbi:hypothetical protein SAMN04488103_11033 [Gemmobacter aquatilis]|uniref:Uncharacterized protein n=2 Tax=Gemmobacter aquatilis TaxID=933059 RepID=A0A1H8KYB5_9RHOB|nr:hypothetical protein SAMN04488103_11033 [Gemmobacter aquatilis]